MTQPLMPLERDIAFFLEEVQSKRFVADRISADSLSARASTLLQRIKTREIDQNCKLIALATHIGTLLAERELAVEALQRDPADIDAALRALGSP